MRGGKSLEIDREDAPDERGGSMQNMYQGLENGTMCFKVVKTLGNNPGDHQSNPLVRIHNDLLEGSAHSRQHRD